LPSCKIIASGSIKRSGTPKAKPEDPNLSNGAPLGGDIVGIVRAFDHG
jgi:DNA-directed RNA polymerase subunit H (RpoH/RPB5)